MTTKILTLVQVVKTFIWLLAAFSARVDAQPTIPPGRAVVPVRYGYFPEARPSHAACARGWLDLDVPSTNTYYQVTCYPQTSGGFAAQRLDNQQLDIANLGSTPWAQAAARGVDIQVVYISHFMGSSQGLYVRPSNTESNYTRISTPYDLAGRRVAVPFGSTMHYQILFLIELMGLTGRVDLVDMSPTEIIEAWDKGTLDAAGCWGVARDHLLDAGGAITLVPARLLADWGRPTFVVTAATRTFAAAHGPFLTHMVGIMSRIDDSFHDRLGQQDENNVRRWEAVEETTLSYVPSLVDALMLKTEQPGNPTVTSLYRERHALDSFIQYTAAEQITCEFLGPAPGECNQPTKQHEATIQTAEFLLDQKVLARLGPLDDETGGSNPFAQQLRGACSDPATFCGGDMLNGAFLAAARRQCNNCLAVGPFANQVSPVSSTNNGQDALLGMLELMEAQNGQTGYASAEVGRRGGDSTCRSRQIARGSAAPVLGSFGDGANGEPGKSYSEDLHCEFAIYSVGDDIGAGDETLVTITFSKLQLWSGDFVRVYAPAPGQDCEGYSPDMELLGQFTGFHDDAQSLPPPLAAQRCMLIVFTTDRNQERTYGGNSAGLGDGFLIQYNRAGKPCSLCSGEAQCRSDGICDCNGQSWGADCSETQTCLGTTRVWSLPQLLTSSGQVDTELFSTDTRALSPGEAYQNDLNCSFEIEVADDDWGVLVEIYYDLEPTYDLIELQRGSRGEAETFAVLTGTNRGAGDAPEEYLVPAKNRMVTLHLTTDSIGRRRGFHATVRAVPPSKVFQSDCSNEPGKSGLNCEFDHCIAVNSLVSRKRADLPSSPYVLGNVVSHVRQTGGVPAMPWAAEGGCVWDLLSSVYPDDTDEVVAFRLVFNSPFDLEPHPINSVGDKLTIRQSAYESPFVDTELFMERCDSDEVCSFPWQTGECGENGGCIVRKTVEIPLVNSLVDTSTISASLVTDRNDGGKDYGGLDFTAVLVQRCPSEGFPCEELSGGKCIDGYCYCGNDACTCPCDGSTSISTGVKMGIVFGVVIPLFAVFFGLFVYYRRRKIQQSRVQKSIIQEKEAQLEAFKGSIIGMRTAIKTYIPTMLSTKTEAKEEATPQDKPASKVIWCWKETAGMISNHDQDAIYGDLADCWVKYASNAASKLEAAYASQGGTGEYSPLPGYNVSFDKMVQTKVQTGFERDVQRVVKTAPSLPDVDLTDAHFADQLPDDLAEEPQMVLVEGDVIQVSTQRPDGWAYGTKLQQADEALSRQLVEVAVGGTNATDDSAILTDTGWFQLEATRIPTGGDLAGLHSRVGQSGALDPPDYWDPVVDPTVVQQHMLPEGNDERAAVEKAFLSTLTPKKFGRKVKVLSVQRLQNLAMWQSYVVKRQTICYRESEGKETGEAAGDVVTQKALDRFERFPLWHGTNVEVMDKIIQQGFNRSFCGKNATVYGKGVYFARDASYSAYPTYSVPDSKGTQYMMACRVVVGEYCVGTTDALTPDIRDVHKNILYDSTVGLLRNDNMTSPSIYVTYHDAQAYPEYLISFRTKK